MKNNNNLLIRSFISKKNKKILHDEYKILPCVFSVIVCYALPFSDLLNVKRVFDDVLFCLINAWKMSSIGSVPEV